MRLNVTYEMNSGVIQKRFEHHCKETLFKLARSCDLYKSSHTVTYELEEVDEDGDKCSEC